MINDFIKYVKDEYDYDIILEEHNNPDTFINLLKLDYYDKKVENIVEQAKQDLINDGYDLEELKKYID